MKEDHITDVSKYLIQFIKEKEMHVPFQRLSKETMKFISQFLQKIKSANAFLQNKTREIFDSYEISKNLTRSPNDNHIPHELWQRMKQKTRNTITFTNYVLGQKIEVVFAIEDPSVNIMLYEKYVYQIFVWLYIVFYETKREKSCVSKGLTIYFFFSPLLKLLPEKEGEPLGTLECNTAYTYTCPKENGAEITIFRKEDWFKTFIHETFHTFSLDFSQMDNEKVNKKILEMFSVTSEVNLFEAYTEFWATIINIIFCSFWSQNNLSKIYEEITFLINADMNYALFQLVKILDHYHLNYSDLFTNESVQKYKENTSVLSYYIIKTILLLHYNEFIHWCYMHNESFFSFQKNPEVLKSFVEFIAKFYKDPEFLSYVSEFEKENKKKIHPFIRKTLKMTLCEMG